MTLMPAAFFTATFDKAQIWIFIASVAEGCRRAQWSLIRVENENNNNFEKYRTILQIPNVKEEDEGGEDNKDGPIK